MLVRSGIRTLAVGVMVFCLGLYVLAEQTCGVEVQSILDAVNALCLNDARDSVCYGNNQVQAQAQPGVAALNFQKPGDQERVALIQSLQLSAMNMQDSTWGIARMRLTPTTARSADDDMILLLFGDVRVDNQGENRTTFDFTVTSDYQIRLRNFPALNSTIIGWLEPGAQVKALGRLADSSWLRVQKQPEGMVGWVSMDVLRGNDLSQIETLKVEDGSAPYYGPMQAFAFTAAGTPAGCTGAVQDGLLIQTPEGVARVSLLINELTIDFVSTGTGTTALVNTQPDGLLAVSMLEGGAYVTSGATTQFIPPGAQLTIPMNGAGQPVLSMAQPVPNADNPAVQSLYSGLDRQPEQVIWNPTAPVIPPVVNVPAPDTNAVVNNPPGGDNNPPAVNDLPANPDPVVVNAAPSGGGNGNGGGNNGNGNGNGNGGGNNGNGNNGNGNGNHNGNGNGNGNHNGASGNNGNGNGNNGNGNGNGKK